MKKTGSIYEEDGQGEGNNKRDGLSQTTTRQTTSQTVGW